MWRSLGQTLQAANCLKPWNVIKWCRYSVCAWMGKEKYCSFQSVGLLLLGISCGIWRMLITTLFSSPFDSSPLFFSVSMRWTVFPNKIHYHVFKYFNFMLHYKKKDLQGRFYGPSLFDLIKKDTIIPFFLFFAGKEKYFRFDQHPSSASTMGRMASVCIWWLCKRYTQKFKFWYFLTANLKYSWHCFKEILHNLLQALFCIEGGYKQRTWAFNNILRFDFY